MSNVDSLKARLKQVRNVGDPPVEPLHVRRVAAFALTAGELRGAIESNPDHPKAADFRKGVAGLPDTQKLAVDRVDLTALLENKDVEQSTIVEDGVTIIRKRVVERKSDTPEAKPAPAPAPVPVVKKK